MLYLGPATVDTLLTIRPEEAVIVGSTPVFGLHPATIRRNISGYQGWVGMSQDLATPPPPDRGMYDAVTGAHDG